MGEGEDIKMGAFVLCNGTNYPHAAWCARRAAWPPSWFGAEKQAMCYGIAVQDGIIFG